MKQILEKIKQSMRSIKVQLTTTLADPEELSKFRRQLQAQLLTAVLLTLVAAGVFLYWAEGLKSKYTPVQVVAANHDIQTPWKLKRSDIKFLTIPQESLPADAIQPEHLDSVLGQVLVHNFSENQVLTRNSFLPNTPADVVGMKIERDYKGMAISTAWFDGNYPSLRRGDTLTFVITITEEGKAPEVQLLGQRIEVLDVIAGSEKQPSTLLIKVNEALSNSILRAHASRNVSLHALVDGYKPPIGDPVAEPMAVSGTTTNPK
ncbi:MAG TPA: hypothetical protein VEA59_01315 [Patescibacteria group bacterium]|nr:hypothetical protein [Patescibacteria group bacterium]